jgi:hypothetical protein
MHANTSLVNKQLMNINIIQLKLYNRATKDRVVPDSAQGIKGSEGRVPLILNLGNRWGKWSTSCHDCITLWDKAPSTH